MNGRRSFGAIAAALLAVLATSAVAEVAVPRLRSRVTDLTGTLSASQRSSLESKLADFEERKGSQIAVLVVPTTDDEPIEDFSIRVVEEWALGRADADDGALLVIAKDDRELRIEVGYGLEGALTDATCKRIIEEIVVPRFREGRFYSGIDAGLSSMIDVIDGEPLPPPRRGAGGGALPFSPDNVSAGAVGVLGVASVLRALFGRLVGASVGGLLAAALAGYLLVSFKAAVIVGFLVFVLLLSVSPFGRRHWHHRRYGGGYSSGGGFGGGGFSGGGGGFGGGGASGRW